MSLNERRKTKSLFSYIHPCLLLVSCGAAVSMQVPMSIVMTVVMPNLSLFEAPNWAPQIIGIIIIFFGLFGPVIGLKSDKCESSLGRRRPFIIFGFVFVVIAMVLFTLMDEKVFKENWQNLLIIFVGFIINMIGVFSIMGTAMTLVLDIIPPQYRMQVNLAVNIGSEIMALAVFGIIVLHKYIFFISVGLYSVLNLATIFFSREKPIKKRKDGYESFPSEGQSSTSSDYQTYDGRKEDNEGKIESSEGEEGYMMVDRMIEKYIAEPALLTSGGVPQMIVSTANVSQLLIHRVSTNRWAMIGMNEDGWETIDEVKELPDGFEGEVGSFNNLSIQKSDKSSYQRTSSDFFAKQSELPRHSPSPSSKEDKIIHQSLLDNKDKSINSSPSFSGMGSPSSSVNKLGEEMFFVSDSLGPITKIWRAVKFIATHKPTLVSEIMLTLDTFGCGFFSPNISILFTQGIYKINQLAPDDPLVEELRKKADRLTSALSIVIHIISLFASLVSIYILKKFGAKATLFVTHMFSTAALFALFFIGPLNENKIWILFVSGGFLAINSTLYISVPGVVLAQSCDPRNLGLFMGAHGVYANVGQLISNLIPLAINAIAPTFNSKGYYYMQWDYLVCACFCALATIVTLFFPKVDMGQGHPSHPQKKEEKKKERNDNEEIDENRSGIEDEKIEGKDIIEEKIENDNKLSNEIDNNNNNNNSLI